MKRYEEYKDSGVQWLGEIPEEWNAIPLKRIIYFHNGADYKDIQQDDGYPVIGSGGQFAYASKYLYDGESVLFGRKGTVDKPLYICGKFWTVDTMFYTEPVHKNQTNCKFIYYAAKTIPYDRYKTATALPSMTQTDLGSHILAYPPFEEQQSIASFLDAKTKPIDDIISKREKQIELLEEMKSAIISHAVTKGLNPDVKMKDSGIEWIGEIPEDWTTSTIGRIYTIILGKMLCPQAPNITYSLESYYCAADVHFYGINNDDLKEMWFSPEEKKRYKVYVNDLLVVEGGAGAGGCFVVKEDSNAYIQNSIMIVRSCNNSTHYLKYFIENIVKRGFVYFECNKATFPHYTREKLSSTRIPVPPLSEQQAIASYLDTETSKLDTRIAKRRRQIELLQEYKQALITDAVTGKIDVREYNKRI